MILYNNEFIKRCVYHFICLAFYLLPSYTIAQNEFSSSSDYRNFYGICWRGNAHENLLYAKQMKYSHVFYQVGMEKDSLSDDLFFYIESPEYKIYNRFIDLRKAYSDSEINFYETRCALIKSRRNFPDNIAKGWFTDSKVFSAQLDFQQEDVIQWTVQKLLDYIKRIEKRNPKFHFAGFAWDVPQLTGDFWDTTAGRGKQIDLSFWNGENSGAIVNRTHQYRTYSEGHLAFYKQLFSAVKKLYPSPRFIIEPYNIYHDWVEQLSFKDSNMYVSPDIILQEKYGTEFIDDSRIFQSGFIHPINVGSSTPNKFEDSANRKLAALAAINGSFFCWFGRFGGTGNMPNYKSITEVPARLKLLRILTTWEDLNNTALKDRHWNGNVYKSTTAYADENLIYLKQPGSNKIFFVPLSSNAKLLFSKDYKVVNLYNTDGFFKETTDASKDFRMSKRFLEPDNQNCINKGYIAYIE